MGFVLFLALVFYSTNASAFQTSKCQHLRERCVSESSQCASVLTLLGDVCSISGSNCTVKDSLSCNKTSQFLIDNFQEFKDCICTKDGCNFKELLGEQCFTSKGKSKPPSAMDIPLNFLQETKLKEIAPTGRSDCTQALEICREDVTCFKLYTDFQRACTAERTKCSLRMVRQQCFAAWRALRKTLLEMSKGPEPMHKTCTKIFNNTCLQYTQEHQTSNISKETNAEERTPVINADHMKIKLQWKSSALSNYVYKHLQSCFRVNLECVNDEVCNSQLSLYRQACQVNGTQCNGNQCQGALRLFYENMPSNVAQMLTFCDCMPSDENCHQAKGFLHGKPCVGNMVSAPSCLSVIHTCQGNPFCWGKFGAFTSKCLKDVSQTCLADQACLLSLSPSDLVCSNSAECRAAYVSMWGTILRVECTCDLTSLAEESACKLFHHILHSKTCFSQMSGEEVDISPSYMDLPGKTLPATGVQPFLNGDTIYFIVCAACIILVLEIILLTVLKTRACTPVYKAKTSLPVYLSERLMTPQQQWNINYADDSLSGSSR
ncbi:GDNF family receptor alpha-like [Hemicordylus capensis]|uniref:GDNF family receptor alpha-like n=1 Tax=Hemicordylus capensis TaxID=884348 RepID=UPI00230213CA|nr:GDNF family receptor alpha-like [Hemicordylus capensis]